MEAADLRNAPVLGLSAGIKSKPAQRLRSSSEVGRHIRLASARSFPWKIRIRFNVTKIDATRAKPRNRKNGVLANDSVWGVEKLQIRLQSTSTAKLGGAKAILWRRPEPQIRGFRLGDRTTEVYVEGEGGHMGNETMKSPDSPPEEPMLNTVGNRGFKWYSNWQQELLCSRCGWVGKVGLDNLEDPSASGASIECPQCHRRIGEVLFPNLRDTEEAAAQGNEAAILELPKFREQVAHAQDRIDRFKREKLESTNQLPELDGEILEFTWDIADGAGGKYQVIRLGDVELWRELAFFDNIPRFQQVKDLLRKKYGTRFKMLKPTEASEEWLCGDNAGKLFRLDYT
jgi:hypothetical protein